MPLIDKLFIVDNTGINAFVFYWVVITICPPFNPFASAFNVIFPAVPLGRTIASPLFYISLERNGQSAIHCNN